MEGTSIRGYMNLRFEDFRRMVRGDTLSPYEKIGFPDSYRRRKEEAIFGDILGKLTNLRKTGKTVVDIGPGCSDLPRMLIDLCRRKGHPLVLIDSREMLDHLPDEPFIVKVPGRYPGECGWLFERYAGKVDAVLCYSALLSSFPSSCGAASRGLTPTGYPSPTSLPCPTGGKTF